LRDGKQSFLYLFENRVNGDRSFPIETPGASCRMSPARRHRRRSRSHQTAGYDYQGVEEHNLIDFTRAAA